MQKFLQKYIKSVVALLILLVLASVLFLGLRKKTQSFYFQDETDHVAMGWMMDTFDKQLYVDLSTNHQPIPVLFGSTLVKIISYDTLFTLIERIRLSMFAFFFLAGVGLVIRFKERGLFAFILTFSVGYYYFAWHVLAESLAVPAVLFIVLLITEKLFYSQREQEPNYAVIESCIAALSLVWIGFCLLPLWPFCVLAGGYLLLVSPKRIRMYGIVTALLAIALIFSIVSPEAWYREAVNNNIKYFIAYEEARTLDEWLTLVLYPFLTFLKPTNAISQMFLIPLLGLLGCIFYGLFRTKTASKSILLKILFAYILLLSLNPRVYNSPVAFYVGFHLFPYVAGYFSIISSVIYRLIPTKRVLYYCILMLAIITQFLFNMQWMHEDTNKLNEYFVQYGTQESYAQLIKVFATEGNTLFSGPNGHGYINMISGVPIAGRQLFHLEWAYRSPQLRTEFHSLMKDNPPDFIYLQEDTSGYHTDLVPILKSEYVEILHDTNRTHLYFSKSKVSAVTDHQRTYMTEKDFSFAE